MFMKKLLIILIGLSSFISQAMDHTKSSKSYTIPKIAEIKHTNLLSSQNQNGLPVSLRVRATQSVASSTKTTVPPSKMSSMMAISEKEMLDATKNKIITFIKDGDFKGLQEYQMKIEAALSAAQYQPVTVKTVIKEQKEIVEKIIASKDVQVLIEIAKASPKNAYVLYAGLSSKATDQMILDAASHILNNKEGFKEFMNQDPSVRAAEYAKEKNAKEVGTAETVSDSSVASTVDFVITPAHPAPNISKEVDARIEAALNECKEDSNFKEYAQSVNQILQDMKAQGLLNPTSSEGLTPEVRDAIVHGIKHFIKQFQPVDPRQNPKEFISGVIKYGVYATFHVMTDGAFLGAEKLATIGTQVHELFQRDFSRMNATQKAEFVAENVAEIVKAVLADQIGKKIIPKSSGLPSVSSSSTSSTREVHEAVTPEGLKVRQPVTEAETPLFKQAGEQLSGALKREQVLDRVKTYEQARNKALEIIGEVDEYNAEPKLGGCGPCQDSIVGRSWHGGDVVIRLDYDPIKGPHINVTDYRLGKGLKGISVAIPFEGDINTVQSLLKHLNTDTNLRNAQRIFEKSGNLGALDIINKKLQGK
jgi:hypothetical protein